VSDDFDAFDREALAFLVRFWEQPEGHHLQDEIAALLRAKAAEHGRRAAELIEAFDCEIERRRKAESDIDRMMVCVVRYCIGRQSYIVGTCDSDLRARWAGLSRGTQDLILKDIKEALERDQLGHASIGMDIDRDIWAALYRDFSPGGKDAQVERQGGSPK